MIIKLLTSSRDISHDMLIVDSMGSHLYLSTLLIRCFDVCVIQSTLTDKPSAGQVLLRASTASVYTVMFLQSIAVWINSLKNKIKVKMVNYNGRKLKSMIVNSI